MRSGIVRWMVAASLVGACSSAPPVAQYDAAVTVDAYARTPDTAAPPPPPETCPPGWVRLPDRNCVPPALACAADAGTTDPTCLPGGLRSAALTPWNCPPGWRADAERGCLPTLRTDCPEGSGPLPDGTCTDTASCPDAPWASIPEEADPARVVYVDDDAPEGGDGSRERPLRDLGAAIQRCDPAGAVLAAAGSYEVAVAIPGRRVVRGVCPSRVLIRATPGGVPGPEAHGAGIALLTATASLDLSGVTLDGQSTHLLMIRSGAAHVHHSIVQGIGGSVLTVFGGSLRVDEVMSRSARSGGNTFIAYSENGELTMRRASATGNSGLFDCDTARAAIEDSASSSAWIFVRNRSVARLARVVLRAPTRALRVERSTLEAEDLVLRGSLDARTDSTFTGRRIRVEDGTVVAVDLGTTVGITDLVTRFNDDVPRTGANCVSAAMGARVVLRSARLGPCWEANVYAYMLGEIEAEDAYIHDPRPNAAGETGVGAVAALAGSVSLRRAVIERAALAGVASIHLDRVMLRRLPLPMWLPMHGAQLQQQPSRLALTDTVIRDSRSVMGQPSFAVAAGANSVTTGERIAVLRQDGAGLLAMESGFDRTTFVDGISRTLRLNESTRALFIALLPPVLDGPSSMTLTDVYVGRVRRASILYDSLTRRTQPGMETAYGAFVSPGCTLMINNGYFDGGDSTESALASLGSLTLRGGVVTGSTRCAATRSEVTGATVTLENVRVQRNGRDEVCVDDTIPALRLPMSPN